MSGRVTRSPERYRKGLLLLSQGKSMALHSGPVVRPPSQDRCPRWGAHRSPGIKPVKAQSTRRHRVKVRSSERRVVVITSLSPTHIICHHQDDVRFGGQEHWSTQEESEKKRLHRESLGANSLNVARRILRLSILFFRDSTLSPIAVSP